MSLRLLLKGVLMEGNTLLMPFRHLRALLVPGFGKVLLRDLALDAAEPRQPAENGLLSPVRPKDKTRCMSYARKTTQKRLRRPKRFKTSLKRDSKLIKNCLNYG